MSLKDNSENVFRPDRREQRILRAKDIMPPYGNSQQPNNGFPPAGFSKDPFFVPHFDLAEEIMAEQRKTTASKRKSPDQKIILPLTSSKNKTPVDLPDNTFRFNMRNEIIVDIVARDIKGMCRLKSA